MKVIKVQGTTNRKDHNSRSYNKRAEEKRVYRRICERDTL